MLSQKLSIIIPCLNEAENIFATLKPLQNMRQRGHEIILCDGDSRDNSVKIASSLVDHCIIMAPDKFPCRASQMNAGAKLAGGDVLCFLHADTLAPESIDHIILSALSTKHQWGFFKLKLNSTRWAFRIIEWLINKRSCLSQIATGDQGIFINRKTFYDASGFAEIPLMEDIALSKRLKKISAPICINNHRLLTSARRWETQGIIRTVLLMWKLRLAYFLGVPASGLANAYKNHDNTNTQ